jgi:hypothetical protein
MYNKLARLNQIRLAVFCFTFFYTVAGGAQSRNLSTIPFLQVTGGVIIVQAQLLPFPDTLQFIFDTGSSGISLDSSTVKYLGLQPAYTGQLIRGVGGIREVPMLQNKSLKIGQLQADSLNFYVNDYTVLTSIYGVRIDGVIGYALLSRFIVQVDYEKQQMNWYTPGPFVYPRHGYLLQPQINKLPACQVQIKDMKADSTTMMIDIGAGLNLLFSNRYLAKSSVLDSSRNYWTTSGEGIGGQIDLRLTVLPKFRIGPYRFKKIPSTLFEDPYNATNFPTWSGLIGSDLLRRFNIVLNYPSKEIHIRPNRYYYEPFDYSYTGMELYLINNQTEVGFVAPSSPAALAGIEVGDQILAINKVIAGSLDNYKAELNHAKKKITLLYKRANKIETAEIKVIHIK